MIRTDPHARTDGPGAVARLSCPRRALVTETH